MAGSAAKLALLLKAALVVVALVAAAGC